MKKRVAIVTCCFCLGLLGLQAETESKRGFNDYNSAAERYSASKVFGSSASPEGDEEGALRAGGGSLPAEPGVPVGTGLGIIALCSGVYILFQSRKKNEKTV